MKHPVVRSKLYLLAIFLKQEDGFSNFCICHLVLKLDQNSSNLNSPTVLNLIPLQTLNYTFIATKEKNLFNIGAKSLLLFGNKLYQGRRVI